MCRSAPPSRRMGAADSDSEDLSRFTPLEPFDRVIQVAPDSLVETDRAYWSVRAVGCRWQFSLVIENRSPVVAIDTVLVVRSVQAGNVPK